MSQISETLLNAVATSDLQLLRQCIDRAPDIAPNLAMEYLARTIEPMPEGVPSGPDGLLAILEVLLDAGADLEGSYNGYPLLGVFAQVDHLDAVDLLLARAAPTDPPAAEGLHGKPIRHTPLMIAAASGSIKCLRRLVEAGADLESADEDGETALAWAVREVQIETAVALWEFGANPNIQMKQNYNLLHMALAKIDEVLPGELEAMLDWLVGDVGQDIHSADEFGDTPLSMVSHEHEFARRAMLEGRARAQARQLNECAPTSVSPGPRPRL